MARIHNYQASQFIENRQGFQGSNFRGVWMGDTYQVFSYMTCIGEWTNGVWFLVDGSYSPTTSKHQNYLRQGAFWSMTRTDEGEPRVMWMHRSRAPYRNQGRWTRDLTDLRLAKFRRLSA